MSKLQMISFFILKDFSIISIKVFLLLFCFVSNFSFFVNKDKILIIILIKFSDIFSFIISSLSINSIFIIKYKSSKLINFDSNNLLK